MRSAGIQILGGAVLLAGLLFTNRSLDLNQQGQITNRFTQATDQLGSEKLDIRLGGIYALERIARDSRADQGPVMEVLTAFVREHASSAASPTASATSTMLISPDIQAVLTVVGRRNVSNDPTRYRLNLSRTDLAFADLRGANLARADLDTDPLAAANLSGADLSDADLSDADLHDANLRGANLSGANLSDHANLAGVQGLTQAQIDSAITDGTTKLPAGLKPHG